MRIGVTTFGCDGGKSGISQYLINLLAALDRMQTGATFEVLVYENERDIYVNKAMQMTTHVVAPSARTPVRDIFWHLARLPGLCRDRGYDLLFLPAGNRRLPWQCPCPTVATVHDFSWLHMQKKYDATRLVYLNHLLPMLIARLTRVITISESSRRDILAHTRTAPDKLVVIPNGVDHSCYYPRDRAVCQAHVARTFGVQGPYLLYISRLEHPGKNHVRLIRAFEQLKQRHGIPHELVLAGGDFLGADQVHRCVAASPVASSIRLTGFARTADLPMLYGAATAFVFPSLYEGFGLPLLEAMACGIPVACSNTSSLPDVAGDAALMFDPSSSDAMADTIARLLLDERQHTQSQQRGLARAQEFSWDACARATYATLVTAAQTGR